MSESSKSKRTTILAWALGTVLMLSAILKFWTAAEPAKDAFAMLAGLTMFPRVALVVTVSGVELVLGAGLLARTWRAKAAVATFLFLLLMTSLGLMLGDGYTSCGCFGKALRLGWQAHAMINLGLLAISATLAWPYLEASSDGAAPRVGESAADATSSA